MKVMTQIGLLDINPESVVAIRKAHVMPETLEFCYLTHMVEFDDRFYEMGGNVVCISEDDAEKLAELAGVEIEGRKGEERKPERLQQEERNGNSWKIVFVPIKAQLSLSKWEKYFDDKMAWRAGKFPE